MSLNWSISGKTELELTNLHAKGLIQAAVFLSMATGVGTLTEKTLPTAMARCRALEALNGPYWQSATEEGLADHLPEMLGLRTNVSTVTDAAWWKMQAKACLGAELARLKNRAAAQRLPDVD